MWCIPDRAVRFRPAIAVVLVAAAITLSGCGFRPLFSRHSVSAPEALAAIAIKPIQDRTGQKLRNLLLDRLSPKGPAVTARYVLEINVSVLRQSLGVKKDAFATRANLSVTASFVLLPTYADRLSSFKGSAVSTNSYNILRSEFATLSARNNALDRALREIADEIRIRIAVALNTPGTFASLDRKIEN